jgi:hypothetical protein
MQVYHIEKWQVYFIGSMVLSVAVLTVTNFAMWIIYTLELPFFERYKVSSEPWPWYEDNAEWRILVKKSLLLVTFNNLVTLPCALLFNVAISGWSIDMSFETEDLPDTPTLMMSIAFFMICEDFAFH